MPQNPHMNCRARKVRRIYVLILRLRATLNAVAVRGRSCGTAQLECSRRTMYTAYFVFENNSLHTLADERMQIIIMLPKISLVLSYDEIS